MNTRERASPSPKNGTEAPKPCMARGDAYYGKTNKDDPGVIVTDHPCECPLNTEEMHAGWHYNASDPDEKRTDAFKDGIPSCMTKFKNLKDLHIEHNGITDLSVLKDIPSLESLDISRNPIEDLENVPNPENYKRIEYDGDSVKGSGKFTSLEEFHNGRATINREISSLHGLKNIWIGARDPSDLKHVKGLTNLEKAYFVIQESGTMDLANFAGMDSLVQLVVDSRSGTRIKVINSKELPRNVKHLWFYGHLERGNCTALQLRMKKTHPDTSVGCPSVLGKVKDVLEGW